VTDPTGGETSPTASAAARPTASAGTSPATAPGDGVRADGTPDIGEALAPLRTRIDEIDHEIVALLDERARIALEIGRVKDASGEKPIQDPAREAAVIEHVTRASSGLFPEPELVALYRTLIAATRKVQEEQRRGQRPGDGGPA
jgi:chorismate mutase